MRVPIFNQVQRGFDPRTLANLTLFVLIPAWLFGGATRFDVLAPVLPMAAGLLLLALLAVTPGRRPLSMLEKIAIGGLFVVPLIQLIPLPPSVWRALPGHDYAARLLGVLGQAPWLPLSLTPSRTISSAFAFVPAVAVYLAARDLTTDQANRVLVWLVGFASVSALLGLAQILGGSGSKLRFYAITNSDAAVGFFSNANHFGTFVALCAPIAAYLGLRIDLHRREASTAPLVIAGGIVSLLIVGALASFSRAAYAAAALALILAAFMGLLRLPLARRTRSVALVGLVVVIAIASFVAFRWTALGRISEIDQVGTDGRLALLPIFARMIAAALPLGTGLGSFDPTYRAYENYANMSESYLNNAHNDLAQITIETGIPGLLVLAMWLWIIWRFISAAAKRPRILDPEPALGRLRLAVLAFGIIVLLAHSLVDYPLRGASVSATFALLLALTIGGTGPTRREHDPAS